jgi:hypothetical protein
VNYLDCDLWVITPCLVGRLPKFFGKPAAYVFTEMKGADFSETTVTAYEITVRSNSEDYNPNRNFV